MTAAEAQTERGSSPMPDEHPYPGTPEHAHEGTVLDLLIDDRNERPWTMHELALEIGSPIVAADAVANLHAAGLVHKTGDGLVFIARAAARFHQIAR
jgi:hypothetical protein